MRTRCRLMLAMVAASQLLLPDPVRAGGGQDALRHSAIGQAAAIPDFPGLAPLCTAVPGGPVTLDLVRSLSGTPPSPFAPAKVFDNLYFVGHRNVSAWVVKTSDGLVLIDTLGNQAEAQTFIEGGLRKLGLSPADIKLIIITHGHGDHTGGLSYLVDRYHPRVVMSAGDWQMVRHPKTRIDAPGWSDLPRPDVTFRKAITFVQGGTRFRLVLTPGHTPGTLSVLFPVSDRGVLHKAILWGGTGFNFGPDAARFRTYATSSEAMRRRVLSDRIDVFLSNHAARDQADVKIAALTDRRKDGPHPFVLTPQKVANAFVTFRECALAQATRLN